MKETVFTYAAPGLKFGADASAEIGPDLARLGVGRVLIITDAGVRSTGHPDRIAAQVEAAGMACAVFDGSRVEPTDESIGEAVDWARTHGPWDAFVAVGGGSSIDTAKAVNLLTTNEGDLFDYLNPPIGAGRAPTHPLRPLVAVPTTTGTGSESTTICVLDVLSLHVKTGISHPALRPTLAVVDPLLSISQPAQVTAASGLDVLCHALESYTARTYTDFEKKAPEQRVPYCGANPIADLWCERSMQLLSGALRAAVRRGDDGLAREQMAMAATFAGLGFGNAGVHIPHANAYPIAGRARDFHAPGYPGEGPLVPHGMAVSLTAPEAFRFTYAASPERHLRAAALLDPGHLHHHRDHGAEALPAVVTALIHDVGMPNGLSAVGFVESDVPDLVVGATQQQRLLATAPRTPGAEDLESIFVGSFRLW